MLMMYSQEQLNKVNKEIEKHISELFKEKENLVDEYSNNPDNVAIMQRLSVLLNEIEFLISYANRINDVIENKFDYFALCTNLESDINKYSLLYNLSCRLRHTIMDCYSANNEKGVN